ncbi:hypothetical protein MSHOH_1925 [Methanosarcina horonobensis HB-1 = JCM 15518]|uniref:Uncharacterized protein n=1 Tax=Methanosarcina horonobensis HB-1 = JCM 15518 TaxID=1434110 RepID=A0A0E3SFV7_9EURY|nr:hypothetical protein [Methanosarcina horonobensis]AKB78408.1 hypothetical protein MSHOH_1925 [Methanosarcina horonobensis HB-1 = JCM 15518]
MSNHINGTDKCKLYRFEKNNYFYGKLMTVRDFETEQSYFDEKRHLVNRLLHGSGLVCGFEDLKMELKGNKILIDFIDGGVALDCCGREIVVPANTLGKDVISSSGSTVSTLPDGSFLYLKYKPCYEGYVAAASNPSSCEERCCPGRVVEDFEVIVSSEAPSSEGIRCRVESSEDPNVIPGASEWLENLEEEHKQCSLCGENQGSKVFLASADSDLVIKREDTEKYRIFFTQKELYQLLKCHILDSNNPHEVTASQTGALVSVDGVSNPGGNVDLAPKNAIVIIPDDTNNLIAIGETHSSRKDNPHEVTAAQTGALVSVSGVGNPGGNIDLTAGANISITPNPAANTIEIASTGGGTPAVTVESVGTSLIVGTSDKYSREDHVHDLGKEVVDFGNLSETLQKQLNLLFMYLRERALKCTVSNFKIIMRQLDSSIAFKISQVAKDAVDNRIYENEDDFISFMKDLLELMKEFADEIQGRVTDISFERFMKSLEELKAAIGSGDAIQVAIQQDEVCFYAMELEMRG